MSIDQELVSRLRTYREALSNALAHESKALEFHKQAEGMNIFDSLGDFTVEVMADGGLDISDDHDTVIMGKRAKGKLLDILLADREARRLAEGASTQPSPKAATTGGGGPRSPLPWHAESPYEDEGRDILDRDGENVAADKDGAFEHTEDAAYAVACANAMAGRDPSKLAALEEASCGLVEFIHRNVHQSPALAERVQASRKALAAFRREGE